MKIFQQKKSGNAKKIGRDKEKCRVYRERGVRLKNKVKRLRKHVAAQPNDRNAKNVLRELVVGEVVE